MRKFIDGIRRGAMITAIMTGATPSELIAQIRQADYDGADGIAIDLAQLRPEFRNVDSLRSVIAAAGIMPVMFYFYRNDPMKQYQTDEARQQLLLAAVDAGAHIVDVMGDESKVSVGDNGNIILNEGVFFDLGSSQIKPESEAVLNELIDVFVKFLSNEENAKYVDSIVISGHTDITGTAETNRQLSTDRANSVLQYLLTGKGAKLDGYAEYFCAAGYGATRPVASNDTAEGQAANRRIEISMILKDESVLEIVEQYLAMEVPGTDANAAASPSPSPSASPRP